MPYIFGSFPAEKIFHSANLYFVASGVIQPAMVRVLFYIGIIRLGVSRAGPLRGTAPLFTMALAFFVFSERPGPFVYAGAILTVLGTWLVSYRRAGEANWRTVDILFPLGAALLASVSQNIRKIGFADHGRAVDRFDGQQHDIVFVPARLARSFGKVGLAQVPRRLLALLQRGGAVRPGRPAVQLSRARTPARSRWSSPIINTTPLFTIAFTAVFLRGEEKINQAGGDRFDIVGGRDRGDYRTIENRMVVIDDAVPVGQRILQGTNGTFDSAGSG